MHGGHCPGIRLGSSRLVTVRARLHFWAGIRSSIGCPCSSLCSISMSNFTPSTTICTSSTSEKPRRSELETSKTPPTAAVSTPPGDGEDRSAGLRKPEPSAPHLCCPQLTCASLLKPQPLEHLRELLMLAQVGQLDMHTCPQASAQVRWAREDVAQVRVPHELVVLGLEEGFNLEVGKGEFRGETWLENPRERGEMWTLGYAPIPPRNQAPRVSRPRVWAPGLTWVRPVQNRVNTSFMLPPFCMEMTRRWSSSLIHTRKVLLSLCLGKGFSQAKIPPRIRS